VVKTGFRSLHYDPDSGFAMNGLPYKVRGFCDHNDMAAVGMAVPDRLNLFRAQASRSVGGNGRRTSHNPPNPSMLDIYDRIGITVMDENRLFDNKTSFINSKLDLAMLSRLVALSVLTVSPLQTWALWSSATATTPASSSGASATRPAAKARRSRVARPSARSPTISTARVSCHDIAGIWVAFSSSGVVAFFSRCHSDILRTGPVLANMFTFNDLLR